MLIIDILQKDGFWFIIFGIKKIFYFSNTQNYKKDDNNANVGDINNKNNGKNVFI